MTSLAIVGSGATGSLTAFMLKQIIPQIKITILDKAKGVGGRMCTSRSPLNEKCTVDLGAQYFSLTPKANETAVKYFNDLLKAKLLSPMSLVTEGMRSSDPEVNHFICNQGSGSIVKYFVEKSGCKIRFSEKVTEIKSSANNRLSIKSDNSTEEKFDAVVFTIPVPQVLQIQGMISFLTEDHAQNMKKVVYNSRFAVGLFFNGNASAIDDLPWDIKYIDNNSFIRYIAVDSKKRGMTSKSSSLVVHSTKEFGGAHIDDNINEIEELLMENLRNIIPNLPAPSHVKCHKWKYSQVEESYSGKPGCITLCGHPLLMCGGDGFSSSTFEGCVYSAEKIVQGIIEHNKKING